MAERGTIECAFELAQSGRCRNVDDVRRKLREEGHSQVDLHLSGKLIRRQLAQMCRAATALPEAAE